jgi:hypothetical protein
VSGPTVASTAVRCSAGAFVAVSRCFMATPSA